MTSDPFLILCMVTAVVMLGIWTMMFPPFTIWRTRTVHETIDAERRERLRRTGGRG